MKKTYQIGLRLPENVYFIFEAEAKKTGENIASIARKKILKSMQETAENSRFAAVEKRIAELENVVREQLKIVGRTDKAVELLLKSGGKI